MNKKGFKLLKRKAARLLLNQKGLGMVKGSGMIFKITKASDVPAAPAGFDYGVSLYYDGDSDKQDAVIVSGVSYADAYRLYMDLNGALGNAGLVVQHKNKAANDAVLPEISGRLKVAELSNAALQFEVKKWKKYYYVAVGFLVVSQWLYLFMPKR